MGTSVKLREKVLMKVSQALGKVLLISANNIRMNGLSAEYAYCH
jgi:hypothetical protein